MSFDQGIVDWVAEALEPLGSVTMRRMMGGATLYLDGTVFAIVTEDGLWFKADAQSDAFWDEADCPRFSYERDGEVATMNYRRAPDDVYDDPDEMLKWAEPAIAAGLRAPKKKPKAKKKKG